MTGHEYLAGILANQAIQDMSEMQKARQGIEACLRSVYGTGPRLYYAGSYGKDTMIKASYDLDIVMYVPPGETPTLHDLYWGVFNTLKRGGYIVTQKDVAIRLPYHTSGFNHIDVVPGRYIDANATYANLYRSETDSRLQTSIKIHIDTIKDSGVRDVIRLVKLWNVLHGLGVRSFALELLTINALKGQNLNGYDSKLPAVLRYLRDTIQSVRLVDPANSNNVISDLIPTSTKAQVAAQARASIDAQSWRQVVW